VARRQTRAMLLQAASIPMIELDNERTPLTKLTD
jgi:hypothetical protein